MRSQARLYDQQGSSGRYRQDQGYDDHYGGGASPRTTRNRDRQRTRGGGFGYEAVHSQEERAHLGDEKALERINSRHFTDACCCAMWLAWTGLFLLATYHSLLHGDPRRLYHGFDYEGQLCGVDEAVADQPYLYWPVAGEFEYPVCMKECPVDDSVSVLYPAENVTTFIRSSDQAVVEEITMTKEVVQTYPTIKVAGRFCLPRSTYGVFKRLEERFQDQTVTNFVIEMMDVSTDLRTAWPLFLILLIVTIAAGYVYIFLMKKFATIITWGVFALLLTVCAVMALYCFFIAGSDEMAAESFLNDYGMLDYWEQWTNSSSIMRRLQEEDLVSDETDAMYWVRFVGCVFAGLFVLLALWMACFCLSVQRALAVLEASCEAMEDISGVLVVPLVEVLLKLVYILIWLALFAWVVTNGELTYPSAVVKDHEVHGHVKEFRYTDEAKVSIVVYIVELVWGLERLTILFQFMFSFAVATWYYTPCTLQNPQQEPLSSSHMSSSHLEGEAVQKQDVGPTVWPKGCAYALGYHHGSLALGSFIVAIFRLFRSGLQAIAKYSKGTGNAIAEAIASSCMACVWCFEEIVRFMNKNAIIELVLNSKDFFTSAGAAVKRLSTAIPEVAALTGITSAFQVVGFLMIGGFGTALALLATMRFSVFSDPASDWYLENRIAVIVVSALISFGVAGAFMFIFDIVSDAMLFCWLVDQEDGKTEFAPAPLRKVFRVVAGNQDIHAQGRSGLSGHNDF